MYSIVLTPEQEKACEAHVISTGETVPELLQRIINENVDPFIVGEKQSIIQQIVTKVSPDPGKYLTAINEITAIKP